MSDALNAVKELEWREEDAEKWLGSPPLVEMVRHLALWIHFTILSPTMMIFSTLSIVGYWHSNVNRRTIQSLVFCAYLAKRFRQRLYATAVHGMHPKRGK